nr:FecR family protein [uncultured Chitinophaga sp.]
MHDQEKIAAIITRLETGTCTPQELEWLHEWYQSQNMQASTAFRHESHRQQLHTEMLQHIHDQLDTAPVVTEGRVVPFYRKWWAAAGLLAAVVSVSAWLWHDYRQQHTLLLVEVGPGQQRQLMLPDSSLVWLNAGARLKYPRTFSEVRTVELEGEGFFDIHPDAQHPFEVHTQELNVQVLGTSFDVKAYNTLDETQVTVKTGMVKVLHHQTGLDVLSANDQLTYSRSAQQYMKSTVENDQINEWANGMISLSQAGFAEVALTLENQYGVRIRYNPAEMKTFEYTLRCSKQLSVTEVLDIISSIHPIQYDIKDNEITIHRKN